MSAPTHAHATSTAISSQPRSTAVTSLPERKRVGARQLDLLCNGSPWQRVAVKVVRTVHVGAPYFCFDSSVFVLCTAHDRAAAGVLRHQGKNASPSPCSPAGSLPEKPDFVRIE